MTPSDRSGGDSRSVEIGLEYPRFQLAKALRNAWASGDSHAAAKVEKWHKVIEGMFAGALTVGSRTPLEDTPSWVTLEVVTGGFATGDLMAGGALADHEIALAGDLGISINSETRAALNGYFLSEDGQIRLGRMSTNGQFRIDVPEEGALLVVAWLLKQDDVYAAQSVLDAIIPFFDRLRFFPQPSDAATDNGAQVFLQSVGETAAALRQVRPQSRLAAQTEAIEVWTPLYDRAVGLLLETVDGEPPEVLLDASGKPARDDRGHYTVSGGMPCQRRPSDWPERAEALLLEYRSKAAVHRLCKAWHREDEPFRRFLKAVESFARDAGIADAERTYLRIALARFIAKRGVPNSDAHRNRREAQRRQCGGPRYHEIAKILAARLDAYPARDGLADVAFGQAAIDAVECTDSVPEGTQIPGHLAHKIGRARIASVHELVEDGYITSADVLANVLPQMTSAIRASSIVSEELRRVYVQIYRAFRRRRSLLLLNLETQVKLEELPWVRALDRYREDTLSDKHLANTVLTDVVALALRHFPYAILPNKLLQDLRTLATQADLAMPIVDELAADIFMGKFSANFAKAALSASALMQGTLYARYYGIDYVQVRNLSSRSGKEPNTASPRTFWHRLFGGKARTDENLQSFSDLCVQRSGSTMSNTWDVAANGTVIEQAQIVTTHNLAAAFQYLDLQDQLGSGLADLAKTNFEWICRRQQIRLADRHARLIMLKNTAYAWRQMIFFMSLLEASDQAALLQWMEESLSQQSADFQARFRPALTGLRGAVEGRDVTANGGRRFLGWVVGPHWMMPA